MTRQHRAVVVEDDADISDLLVLVFEQEGLSVATADNGAAALELIRATDPDLVTLDLTLPDMDGVEICRRLREFSDAYVIMITGRSDEIDRLMGLEVGADDYMSKPFSPREVRARASALLRRPRLSASAPAAVPATEAEAPAAPSDIDAGDGLVVSTSLLQATLDGELLPLTPAEFQLLAALVSRPDEVWERGALVREVWQGEFIESDYLVDVHVGSLRRKLRRPGEVTSRITTVDGASYRFGRS